jgi:hypothetical protein
MLGTLPDDVWRHTLRFLGFVSLKAASKALQEAGLGAACLEEVRRRLSEASRAPHSLSDPDYTLRVRRCPHRPQPCRFTYKRCVGVDIDGFKVIQSEALDLCWLCYTFGFASVGRPLYRFQCLNYLEAVSRFASSCRSQFLWWSGTAFDGLRGTTPRTYDMMEAYYSSVLPYGLVPNRMDDLF